MNIIIIRLFSDWLLFKSFALIWNASNSRNRTSTSTFSNVYCQHYHWMTLPNDLHVTNLLLIGATYVMSHRPIPRIKSPFPAKKLDFVVSFWLIPSKNCTQDRLLVLSFVTRISGACWRPTSRGQTGMHTEIVIGAVPNRCPDEIYNLLLDFSLETILQTDRMQATSWWETCYFD